MSAASFEHVGFLAACIASDLAAARRALESAVANDDMDAVVAVNALVCRAGLLADQLSQATGGSAVEGCAEHWSLSDGEVQHLYALQAKAQRGKVAA